MNEFENIFMISTPEEQFYQHEITEVLGKLQKFWYDKNTDSYYAMCDHGHIIIPREKATVWIKD